MTVYVLCGFDTTLEQDLDRIYTLRDLGYAPYVMIYDKYKLKKCDQAEKNAAMGKFQIRIHGL